VFIAALLYALIARQARRAVMIGVQRTIEQGPSYAMRLIVDIAIRVLSPAVNDPTTAVQAIGQLDDLLRRVSRLANGGKLALV
jgi:uncharacterized membrane protein